MSYYKQPGHATGNYNLRAVVAICPADGLVGRLVGTTAYAFRCDNGHEFDFNATSVMPPPPVSLPSIIRTEPGASSFVDEITGLPERA